MESEFGISRGDVEAAEAETARKLAADRAVELESPKLGLRLDTSQLNLGIRRLLDVYFHCTAEVSVCPRGLVLPGGRQLSKE